MCIYILRGKVGSSHTHIYSEPCEACNLKKNLQSSSPSTDLSLSPSLSPLSTAKHPPFNVTSTGGKYVCTLPPGRPLDVSCHAKPPSFVVGPASPNIYCIVRRSSALPLVLGEHQPRSFFNHQHLLLGRLSVASWSRCQLSLSFESPHFCHFGFSDISGL